MENREQQILSEIKDMMGTIRTQLELLDAKMAELQQCVDPEDFDNNPIELDIDDIEAAVQPDADVVEDDLPFDDMPESESEPEPEPEPEPTPEPEPEPETEPESEPEPDKVEEDDDDDLPGIFDQPVPVYEAAQTSPKVKPTVAEVMVAEMQAWRTDMPGTPVKDVRSAISLNDRIIFINYLFNEDPLAFQNAITQINTMATLDQVVNMSGSSSRRGIWDRNSFTVS